MAAADKLTRRDFLARGGAFLAGGFAAHRLLPSGVLAAPGIPGANDRVAIGFIGAGGRGRQLMKQLPKEGEIIAVCDCLLPRAEDAARQANANWIVYQDHRELLDVKAIDAVVVPTHDHGRALTCIHACQAGKDIYAEKPLTLTVREGRVLANAVRKYKRVFQTGSQQRSMEMNRFACAFVRSGGLGKVHTVQGCNYTGPGVGDRPEQPIPAGLDWDRWCNATRLRPYHRDFHFGWMGWKYYSGGEMTNWGAHGIDQVQWALGTDGDGPVEMWPESEGTNGKVSFRYASGVLLKLELQSGPMGGAIFLGEKGKLTIDRNVFQADPPDLIEDVPPPDAAKVWEGEGWVATLHQKNWLDCIKTRELPSADVEIGHRSISICHLANIARDVGRKLRWDPKRELFVGDDEANTHLDRPRRKGYEYPDPL